MALPPDWEPAAPAPAPHPEPMNLGSVFTVGARIIRRRWTVLLAIAVLFVGPGSLLTTATSFRVNDVLDEVLANVEAGATQVFDQSDLDRIVGAVLAYLAATVAAGLLASIGTIGFSAVVGADFFHRPMGIAEALAVSARRALSGLLFIVVTTAIIIAITILGSIAMVLAVELLGGGLDEGGPGVFLLLVIGVALVLGVVYLTMRWAPALPAIANERIGVRDAFRRSWHLSGNNVWRIFAVILVAGLFTAAAGVFLGLILSLLLVDGVAAATGIDPVVAESISLAVTTTLLAPVGPVLTAVLYFDLRVRRDPPGSITA